MSGGEGSELYRITLPDEYIWLTIDTVSARLRPVTIRRRCCRSIAVGMPSSIRRRISSSNLGTLAPLKLHDLYTAPKTAAVVPSA